MTEKSSNNQNIKKQFALSSWYFLETWMDHYTCLTSYTRGGICGYVGVHRDLRVEDAAVGVGIHL